LAENLLKTSEIEAAAPLLPHFISSLNLNAVGAGLKRNAVMANAVRGFESRLKMISKNALDWPMAMSAR